jgi:hypothetical protein
MRWGDEPSGADLFLDMLAERRRAKRAAKRAEVAVLAAGVCSECGVQAHVVDPPNGCPWHPF